MRYSVDHLENGIARLLGDDDSLMYIALDQLPAGIRTGDILTCCADGCFCRDADEAATRRQKAAALFHRLKKHSH